MHVSTIARSTPDKPAIVDASTGETLTFADLDRRSNQIAHLLRSLGLQRGDRIAFMLENGFEVFDICNAGLRAGLYVTPISTRLTATEIGYVLQDSGSKVFFASACLAEEAVKALALVPGLRAYSVGGAIQGAEIYEQAVALHLPTPIRDESTGLNFYYSSGSTGRPKGIKRELFAEPLDVFTPHELILGQLWGLNSDTIYLHPAPLYHAAPLHFALTTLAHGGTYIMMSDFDPETAMDAIDRYGVTHSQWVPTMFNRMLRLPADVRARYKGSTHTVAIHSAAPCPVDTKRRIMEWWGPIIYEYYAASEGNGICRVGPEEWLKRPGTVGKALFGTLHIVGEDGNEVAPGVAGEIYFGDGAQFSYHNDIEQTRSSRHSLGWTTVGDVGYVDEEGYLFLTDRVDFMIISGGVNIYPAEAENVLHGHPAVVDVAVIGVPNPDFGEEVKAIVQPVDMANVTRDLEAELIRFCRERIADIKCPRSIDFVTELPRLPTGKLQKKLLRAPYWAGTPRADFSSVRG